MISKHLQAIKKLLKSIIIKNMIVLVSKEINQLKERKENNGSVCSGSYYYNNNCYYNRDY
jgi:hypothetical protein